MKERIRFAALPARSKPLDELAISAVFGGCGTFGDDCRNDKDCCEHYGCYNVQLSPLRQPFNRCERVTG
jgi:hypothetical protein